MLTAAMTVDQLGPKSNTSEDPKRIHVARKEDLETRSVVKREPVRPRTRTKEVERGSKSESWLREAVSMSGYETVFFGIPGGGAAILQMEFIEDVMDVILHGRYFDL